MLRRAGIERELASRVDQRTRFGHVERMDEYRSSKGVDGGCKWRAVTGCPLQDDDGINCKKGVTTENEGAGA